MGARVRRSGRAELRLRGAASVLRHVCIGLVVLAALQVASARAAASRNAPTPSFGGCQNPPTVSDRIPADSTLSQPDVDCFAWQELIALNWPANPSTCASNAPPPVDFGDPSNSGEVVWQTYKGLSEVFLPNAQKPQGWCEPETRTAQGAVRRPYALSARSEFAGGPELDLEDFHEAAPNGSWLTAQNGRLTLYDIRLNEDEFDYIDTNGLYNAFTQQQVAQNPTGISLPDQATGVTTVGSIELKAAWIELTNPADDSRFLTTTATVTYPGQKPRTATMGLVGLSIIHKTKNAPQFIWATFEHVGNAPSASEVRSGHLASSYTYYNPACAPASDTYKCAANPTQCPKTGAANDCVNAPYDAPEQVVREQAIPTAVVSLNEAVWGLIEKANPKSVFLNYQLINVLWPNAPFTVSPRSRTPLLSGNPQPQPPAAVANAAIETYVQNQSCLSCHVYGGVAPTNKPLTASAITVTPPLDTPPPPTAPYAADYSFVLGHAQVPAGEGSTGLLVGGLAAAGIAGVAAAAALARRRRSVGP
jgi:hypothetical protein